MSRVTTDYFATASTLLIFDDFTSPERRRAFDETWDAVKALLSEIDLALSPSHADSDVSRFNRLGYGETISVSRHTANVLAIAQDVYALSGGKYDPTVSALVDLWGFSPRFTGASDAPAMPYDRARVGAGFAPPSGDYVEGLKKLVAFPEVRYAVGTITKKAQPAQILGAAYAQTLDLGGIGKGYAVDQVVELLRERGYEYGHFSCGGSSLAVLKRATASKGAPEPAQWGVAIQKPRHQTRGEPTLMRVFTQDMALSTSGDYEHTYTVEGIRYTHLIDPGTGYPINMPTGGVQKGICSATVFGGSAAFDDALSTALCAMGLEGALELMNTQLADYRFVLLLYGEACETLEYVTNIPEKDFEFLDGARCRGASETVRGKVVYTGELIKSE